MKSKPSETNDELAETLAMLDAEEAELLKLIADDKADQEAKLTEIQRSFRARKKQEEARFKQATDSEYWFCVCFLTREQKDAFLKHFGWDEFGNKYIDGVALSENVKFELPAADLSFKMEKADRRLNEISLPLE